MHSFLIFSWKQSYLVAYIGKEKQKYQITNIGVKSNAIKRMKLDKIPQ